MKIAIVGSFNFHLECIGFLLEIYNNNTVDIYIGKKSDRFEWIKYYLTIFNFNVIYNNFNKDIINNYNKIFKLSSNDYCLDNKKIISILHLDGINQRKCSSEKFISLTPFIKGNNIHNIFPVYRPILTQSKISNNIIMIGHYKNNRFDDDIINFINVNSNYIFFFLINGSSSYPNLSNCKNVKIISYCKTNIMNNLINESKFILSKKYINYDRFSGQLGLAMSYEKPLIIDIKTKDTYNLPGISFKNNYSEIGKLDNITDEKYNLLKNEINSLKTDMIKKNKTIFELEF
jgi:hypothetical protein